MEIKEKADGDIEKENRLWMMNYDVNAELKKLFHWQKFYESRFFNPSVVHKACDIAAELRRNEMTQKIKSRPSGGRGNVGWKYHQASQFVTYFPKFSDHENQRKKYKIALDPLVEMGKGKAPEDKKKTEIAKMPMKSFKIPKIRLASPSNATNKKILSTRPILTYNEQKVDPADLEMILDAQPQHLFTTFSEDDPLSEEEFYDTNFPLLMKRIDFNSISENELERRDKLHKAMLSPLTFSTSLKFIHGGNRRLSCLGAQYFKDNI